MKKHLTYLLFLTIPLWVSCIFNDKQHTDYNCYATNVITLFKNGVPIDTFNFYDIQYTVCFESDEIKEKQITKGPLPFSKDSVLKFFLPCQEYRDGSYFVKYGSLDFKKDCGVIVIHNSYLRAPTLFITPEGYKLLELCDYDSVAMLYTFDSYMCDSQSTIDELADMGYVFN